VEGLAGASRGKKHEAHANLTDNRLATSRCIAVSIAPSILSAPATPMLRPKKTVSAPAPRARATRTTPAAPRSSRGPVTVGRAFALDVPFAMRGVASASGARWDADHSVFVYRGDSLPAALEPFRSAPFSLERRAELALNGEGAAAAKPDGAGLVPRAHQRIAIAAIGASAKAKRPGFLLADDVGLGKTISAWQAILDMPKAKTVLIATPLAVVAHWRRTILAMGDGGKDVVVMNYERLGKLFDVKPGTNVKSKKGLARHGRAEGFDVVVWDESHRCKNPTAARSKLAAKLNATAGFVLWLSATAGQNPLELSYLAPLLANVTGDKPGNLKDFEGWCLKQGLGVSRGNYGKWEWRGDPADCEKVRAMLFDGAVPAGLRRRPQDIAGWPEINRILTPIELDPSARQLYEQAWTEFRRQMDLDVRGKDPKGALAAMLRFRQKSSLLRVPGTVELALELLENGHQVAISVAFIETLDAIWEALDKELGDGCCAAIHGQISTNDKEVERVRFQRGKARVVLFTVEEGISLHQGEELGRGLRATDVPRSEIIHDLRWSAIQMAQIEGRCHRDGKFAQVYWAFADGTLEERIAQIVAGRIQSMQGMIGDDTETIREIERLLRGG